MKEQILVTLDGSSMAEGVLPHAKALARATNDSILLLRVVPPPVFMGVASGMLPSSQTVWEGWEREPEQARAYIAGVARRLEAEGFEVHTQVVEDDPTRAIIHYVDMHPNVTMIAMSTHGRSGFGRWLMGSVAEKVLHASPVPLLLVRPEDEINGHSLKGTAEPMVHAPKPHGTLMVPLDGSPFAEQALHQAVELASAWDSTLVLLSVMVGPEAMHVFDHGSGEQAPLWLEKAAQVEDARLNQYLFDIAQKLRAEGLRVKTKTNQGDPAGEILRVAQEEDAGLIVMATHGRTGLERLWLGSVAMRVVQAAHVPVLLVRATEQTSKVLPEGEIKEHRDDVALRRLVSI
ncbi:MAG: universal stress protein [Chloroflexota bacterium]|nr:universal stress protein [Chloroflexota bacterium]